MLASINRITVLLHPLHKLQVIQWPSLNELAHFDVLHNQINQPKSVLFMPQNTTKKSREKKKGNEEDMIENLSDLELIEHILKNLIVLNHLILTLGIKVNLMHRNSPRVYRIHELTMNSA